MLSKMNGAQAIFERRTIGMNGSNYLMSGDHRPSAPRGPAPSPPCASDGGTSSSLPAQSILRLVEEQGQLGFWWQDLGLDRFTESPGLVRITGTPAVPERKLGDLLRQIHPQDQPFQSDQMSLIQDGHPLRREFRLVRPDGTIRWVSSRIDVCLGEDGRPIRYIGVLADITERREAQRAVEFNQERRAALLDAISALTWVADRFGQPVDHTAWCALTGMMPEQCSDEGWLDAVHPNDRDRVRTAYRTAIADATVYNIDYRILETDGRYGWFNARSTPVRDASGFVREWQGIILPIADEQRAATETRGNEVGALTGAQIRGARGLLDWSLAQLASASGVSVSTIKRMEDGGEGSTRVSKSDAVRRALEDGGVSFRSVSGSIWLSC